MYIYIHYVNKSKNIEDNNEQATPWGHGSETSNPFRKL